MSLQDQIANVYDKDSFIKYLNLLAKDSEENPQEWENTTVSQYLQSIASWIEDWSSRYGNEEFENWIITKWQSYYIWERYMNNWGFWRNPSYDNKQLGGL